MQRTPKLTWIGGAFFFDEHDEGQVEITVYPPGLQIRPFATIDARAWALFGQATYKVSSRVSLTGGVRYTDEQKETHNTGGVYRLGTASSPIRPRSMTSSTEPPSTPGRRRAASRCRHRATRSSTSQPRGASRAAASTSPPRQPGGAFGPEFAWSYEGGLKRTMAGGRVRANAAVFYSRLSGPAGADVRPSRRARLSAMPDRRPSRASKSRWLRRQGAACSSRATSRGSTRPTTATSPSGQAA